MTGKLKGVLSDARPFSLSRLFMLDARTFEAWLPRVMRTGLSHLQVIACVLTTFGSFCASADAPGRATDDATQPSELSCATPHTSSSGEPFTVKIHLGEVPALVRVPARINKPPILLWHGFGPPSSSEALMEALPLDEVSALKVYLTLPLFGERAPEGGMEEIARRQTQDYGLLLFEPAVIGAARELAGIVEDLEHRKCLHPGEGIGLLGFSAGGAAVFFALAQRAVPVSAAVTLNAPIGLSASIEALERATKRTYEWTPRSRDLAKMTDAVLRAHDIAAGDPPVALLLWHGAADRLIATRETERLHQTLAPLYSAAGHPERLQLTLAAEAAHNFTDPQVLGDVRRSVASWFDAHL